MSPHHPIVVREFDCGDIALLRQWWEVGQAVSAARAVDLWTPWEQAEKLWAVAPVDRAIHMFGAYEGPQPHAEDRGDVMVGAGRLVLSEKDNTHLAIVELYVRPDRRHAGIGRRLLTAMEEVGAVQGRSTFLASIHARPDDDAPPLGFAESLGYAAVAREEIKVAELAATEPTWPGLEAEAAERLGGYELVCWTDVVAPEHLDDMLRLLSLFGGEVPMEGADLHAQLWDGSRLRRTEQQRLDAGYRHLVVAARAPGGRLVGYSDVLRGEAAPHWAGINGTLVMPEHRGHRLGLAMKVRLHQLVRETFPDCRFVMTGNAGVNAHMNAVNARLGYRVVEVEVLVQKVLPA